jgi:hypothetical protein
MVQEPLADLFKGSGPRDLAMIPEGSLLVIAPMREASSPSRRTSTIFSEVHDVTRGREYAAGTQ